MPKNPLEILEDNSKQKPWYSEGLRFQCTECGQCCTGAPGYVWLTQEEIQKMAKYLKLSLEDFSQRYVRKVGNRWSLKEEEETFDCVFLSEKKCTIYPVRPKQCRTFPWWRSNLKSPKDWSKAAKWCEGIRDEAPVVSYQEIQTQLEKQLNEKN